MQIGGWEWCHQIESLYTLDQLSEELDSEWGRRPEEVTRDLIDVFAEMGAMTDKESD